MREIKTSLRAFFVTLAITMLLVSMSSLTSSAFAKKAPETDIGYPETELIQELIDAGVEVTSEDIEKAVAIREMIEAELERQIQESIGSQISALSTSDGLITPLRRPPGPGPSGVYLGVDKTFTTADRGDYDWWKWGITAWLVGYDYNTSRKEATAVAFSSVLGAGWGGCGAWAWVGKYFYVANPEGQSQAANIRMTGHLWGLLTAAFAGSFSVNIEFVVKDRTTETEYKTDIFSRAGGGAYWESVDWDFNNGIAVVLQGGHSYYAYLKVTCAATTYGYGFGSADFGPLDGDGGWTRYFDIVIDF